MARTQVEVPSEGVVEWWRALTKAAKANGNSIVVQYTQKYEYITSEAMQRVPWFLDQRFPSELINVDVEVWIEDGS